VSGGALSLEQVLGDKHAIESLLQAWLDSDPGIRGGHEEGGFIVRRYEGSRVRNTSETEVLECVRWPVGGNNQINVPDHPDCQIEPCDIVLSFHTHPNTGPDFLQEPSETDIRAVREDPNLKRPSYLGELVISDAMVFHISPGGTVKSIDARGNVLGG
jgi:hypothetical protein